MKNLSLLAFLVLIFTSCSHVVTMKSSGSSLDNNGDLTIYFKHKDKVAYAIIEPFVWIEEEEVNENLGENIDQLTLVVTSKDKKKIDSIVLKDGDDVIPKSVKNFYAIEIDDEFHEIKLDTITNDNTHNLWHAMSKLRGSRRSGNFNIHLYDVNFATPDPTHLTLRDNQDAYVQRNISAPILYYTLYSSSNSLYDPVFGKTQLVTGIPNVYYYPHQSLEYLLISEISTTDNHHYHAIPLTNNPSAIRNLFATGR